jgi:hypothetical protein
MIQAKNLWKRFGRLDALQGLNFAVPNGSAYALTRSEWGGQNDNNQGSDEHH